MIGINCFSQFFVTLGNIVLIPHCLIPFAFHWTIGIFSLLEVSENVWLLKLSAPPLIVPQLNISWETYTIVFTVCTPLKFPVRKCLI